MKLFSISLITTLLVGVQSPARVIEPLKYFLDGEIQKISDAVNNAAIDLTHSKGDQTGEESFYLRNFLIRITALVGFDVVFGSVTAMPEVELLWQRGLPEGWESYKP